MKKQYIKPSMYEEAQDCMQLLSGSVTSTNGIGYGGVDNGGTKDPSSRSFDYGWEDDEEE